MESPWHIIKSQQFNREELDELFVHTDEMNSAVEESTAMDICKGKILAALFYEESLRTRMSFEAAFLRLGGSVISTENARKFSSAAKGESLDNTIRVLSGMVDIIVLRHYMAGASEIAARVSTVPIINAGDGPGQHPTQAILDLYTIRQELNTIDGIRIALVGDLANGRAVRSLAYLLAKYKIKHMYLVSPPAIRMGDDVKAYLDRHDTPFSEAEDLIEVAANVDVLYQTRIQKERFGDRINDYIQCCGQYIVNERVLAAMNPRSIVMHPLPINQDGEYSEPAEIAPSITDNVEQFPQVAYIRQAQNGLFVRMALLKTIFSHS